MTAQDVVRVKVKTLLVDDSITFLSVACRYLATLPVEIAGEALTGRDAIAMEESCKPDLVLLDIEIGELNGFELLRQFKAKCKPPRVIIVTLHDQDEYRSAAAQAGADGFIVKREFATALAPLIEKLFNLPAQVDPSFM